jgi:hypothetical protein
LRGDPISSLVHLRDRGPHQNFSIAGVTGDVHQTALNAPPQPEMDMSFAQLATSAVSLFLLLVAAVTYVPASSAKRKAFSNDPKGRKGSPFLLACAPLAAL